MERSFGSFSRSLTLPQGIDPEAVAANFDRGVLEIRIPKPEQRKPRKIAIGGQDAIEGESRRRLEPCPGVRAASIVPPALPGFDIHHRDAALAGPRGTLRLAHGEVRTPAFVPLATKAVVKTLEVSEAPSSATTWSSATRSTSSSRPATS